MVDVGAKKPTRRSGRAAVTVHLNREAFAAVRENRVRKGSVMEVARVAGISAAKQTSTLIPLCHPLTITNIILNITLRPPDRLEIESIVEAHDRTGVEMEALTAASVSALTVYDMCKAIDKGITITDLRLLEKKGGRSGHYRRKR